VNNVLNGLSALQLAGVNNYLITYPSFPNTAYTVFTLQYLSSSGSYSRLLQNDNNPAGSQPGLFIGVGSDGTSVATFTGPGSGWNDVSTNSPGITNLTTWRMVTTWVSGSTLTPYVDGTAQANKVGTTRAFSNLNIGSYPDTTPVQGWNGFVGEILVYNSSLTTAQRQQIEGYLAWKWGLQANLPADNPFKTYRPLAQTPIPTQIVPMPTRGQTIQVFVPTQISGCQLWLDGADPAGTGILPANGATVSTWNDKSGNGRNAPANTTGALFATNSLNGNGSINITTRGQYYITSSFVPSSTNTPTVFIVVRQTSHTGGNNDFIISTAGYQTFDIFTKEGDYRARIDMYNNLAENGLIPISSPAIISVVGSGAPTYSVSMYGNGTVNTTFTGDSSSPMSVSMGFSIGALAGFIGNIYDVIMYNTALSTLQRQQVEGYLAWKWGLVSSLPNGHPYKQQQIAPFPFRTTPFKGSLTQWQPTQISGCQLWLDAADVNGNGTNPLNGASVSTWRDKSGNGRNAVGFTGTGTYSSTGFNSRQTIQITPNGNMASPMAAGTLSTGFAIFVVFQKTGANNSFDTLVTRTVTFYPAPFDTYSHDGPNTSRLVGDGTNYSASQQAQSIFRTTTPTIYFINVGSSTPATWNESINGTLSLILQLSYKELAHMEITLHHFIWELGHMEIQR
jgi:hypothetical protein